MCNLKVRCEMAENMIFALQTFAQCDSSRAYRKQSEPESDVLKGTLLESANHFGNDLADPDITLKCGTLTW